MYLWLIKDGNDEASCRWIFTTCVATIVTVCIYVLRVSSTGSNITVFQIAFGRKN